MKKHFSVLFLLFIILARILVSEQTIRVMKNIFLNNDGNDKIVIVIDPGHGGRDPGKVGVDNLLEKDINLSIALRLKNLLEQNDIKVVMSRTEDVGLYSETDSNKKRADLNNRIHLIHNSGADLAVSIHQNSFGDGSIKGAQAFFHSESKEGRRLAEILQEQIKETIRDGNHRKAKANSNYYMLKFTKCPLVIVECGFVSNYEEAKLLSDENYQEKMAWAIHLGIMRYINEVGKDKFIG